MDRIKKYTIFKRELLKYSVELKSETYGYQKIDFEGHINIQDILDLILQDERRGIHLLKFIDLTNIKFDNQNIEYVDFTDTNAKINPQTIRNRSLIGCTLKGVHLEKSNLKGVKTFKATLNEVETYVPKSNIINSTKFHIQKLIKTNPSILSELLNCERNGFHILQHYNLLGVDFSNQNVEGIDFSKTNANIDPQTVKNKSLKYTTLPYGDYKHKSFDNTNLFGTNFRNTKNANIDPQTIRDKDLRNAILANVDFKGKSFDNTLITCTNFAGAKNVDLDPQTLAQPTLYGCTLNGIDFKGKSFKGISIINADFTGTLNVKIDKYEVWACNIEETKFDKNNTITGIEIIRKERQNQSKQEIEFQKELSKHILNNIPKCI